MKYDPHTGEPMGVNYVTTGLWGGQCITQARKMLPANKVCEVTNNANLKMGDIAPKAEWKIKKDAAFVHYCQNETVHGFQWQGEGTVSAFPFEMFKGQTVVCDMSSDIGTRKIDWSKYGMVYAGAQKNLGAAGLTITVVREDLLGSPDADTPFVLDWTLNDKNVQGYFNTPACHAIYITGLNVAHMVKQGGLVYYADLANRRASLLYNFIDNSNGFYI